ncbi:hypothetical protein BGZ83_007564 [Gryganskiella cystojenkinii]|nr:hypothetical protein BGZ83_007564 [Gryganskiella cystojenkinii]
MSSFLKISKKNKTSSAGNTPAQTPRTSVHLSSADMTGIVADFKNETTQKQLELALSKSNIGFMQAMSISRM